MTATSITHRVLSALLALGLLFIAVVTVAEVVLANLHRPPWLVPYPRWANWLSQHSWNDSTVIAGLVVLALVGLVLLFLALRRGKPATLPLTSRSEGVLVSASRRGVEKSVAAAAERTSGVTNATASAGRRSVRVEAHTTTRSQSDLQQQVTAAVHERLDSLGLAERLHPRVRIINKEAR
ncbi:MAG: DUF6286 domain-containing protein [Intrasporangium sp.]|uniref:DUF6286 domain-containing protein n=1 Tax=Intrasporangium sp. TaxID=1925024 RepID=UPI003F814665